ncbi:MAG: BON domain-containing protein, partial [Gemmataceae bacterium]
TGAGQSFGGPTAGGGGGGAGGRGGTASTGPAASNFLGTTFVYPYVTSNYTTDASSGTTAGTNSQVGKSGVGTNSPGAASFFRTSKFGAPLYTITASSSGRGGTATATVNNGANMGYVGASSVARMPRFAATLAPALLRNANRVPPSQLQTDLTGLLAKADHIPSRQAITVQVTGNVVTLTGQVGSDEERRDAEGLLSLTPGVGSIVNKLEVK